MFFRKKHTYTLTPIQELLLALLRAQLWLKPVDDVKLPTTIDDWDFLMNLAYKQAVVCFISAACLRHKDVDSIPCAIREEMHEVIEENKKIHKKHNEVLIDLITFFEKKGFHPILLKGQGIAQMYLQPELRQCGDIDLFFVPEEYKKIKEEVQYLTDERALIKETYKHFNFVYKGIEIEIHRNTCNFPNPFLNSKFKRWTYEYMRRPSYVVIYKKKILIPTELYNIIYIFVHMWHHFECGKIKLRQLCDVIVITESSLKDVSNKDFKAKLKYFSMYDNFLVFDFFSASLCGLTTDFMLEKRNRCSGKAKMFLSMVFQGGIPHILFHDNYCMKFPYVPLSKIYKGVNYFLFYYPIIGQHVIWRFLNKIKK